jgi:hypothetical protein
VLLTLKKSEKFLNFKNVSVSLVLLAQLHQYIGATVVLLAQLHQYIGANKSSKLRKLLVH